MFLDSRFFLRLTGISLQSAIVLSIIVTQYFDIYESE